MRTWVAIYSLFMFCFDTGSDSFVVVGLYYKCHIYYAINVLAVVMLPGVIYGWYIRSTKRRNKEKIPTWMVPFAPLWFTPYSIYKLILAIWKSSGGPGPGKLLLELRVLKLHISVDARQFDQSC